MDTRDRLCETTTTRTPYPGPRGPSGKAMMPPAPHGRWRSSPRESMQPGWLETGLQRRITETPSSWRPRSGTRRHWTQSWFSSTVPLNMPLDFAGSDLRRPRSLTSYLCAAKPRGPRCRKRPGSRAQALRRLTRPARSWDVPRWRRRRGPSPMGRLTAARLPLLSRDPYRRAGPTRRSQGASPLCPPSYPGMRAIHGKW
jgi:hypothetical protein